jgi:hypothetical protein
MNFFVQLLIGVGLSLLSALFYKPPPGPTAASKKDFGIPHSDEGTRVLDFAGTVWDDSPHVVWSGDFRYEEIKKKGGKK